MKLLEKYKKELEEYDRNPTDYKQKAKQKYDREIREYNREIEKYNRHLEKIKCVEQSHEWEFNGKCPNDGGKFVGFFSKKCEICGRKK